MRLRRTLSALCVGLLLTACAPAPSQLAPTPSSPSPTPIQLPIPANTWPDLANPDRRQVDSNAKPRGFVSPPQGSGLGRYFNQKLHWQECGGFECAEFAAPLDWNNPDAQAITISMKRATAEHNTLGSLFINPGGPGMPAKGYVDDFHRSQLSGYDIIGMDSRGSGDSTPVVCGTTEELDSYFAADISPDDASEEAALVDEAKKFADGCRRNSGVLLDHISTIETMYDYDLARQLVGDEKLNFYGISYGTFLGAVYAELFPDKVGRMVLDAPVQLDPNQEVPQAVGFERALHAWAAWCGEQTNEICPLGNNEDEVVQTFVNFLEAVDAKPLQTGTPRQLTQSLAVSGLAIFFYGGQEYYQQLAQILSAAIQTSDGSVLLMAADQMNDRSQSGYSSLATAFPAISCADTQDDGLAASYAYWRNEVIPQAPVFGKFFGPDDLCPIWTAKPMPRIKFSAAGAAPIVVVGSTLDSATPYEQAVTMADSLESAVLVTREGPGHGSLGDSECVDKAVFNYLNHGRVPAEGTRCH